MTPLEQPVVLALSLTTSALAGGWIWAHRTHEAARGTIERLRRRAGWFPWTFAPLVAGTVLVAEAQALADLSGAAPDHPLILGLHATGLALVLVGLALLDVLVLWPEAEGDPDDR